jgi:hypothetical protein
MPAEAETAGGTYTGWVAGALVIVAVLVIAAVLWFHYHP